MFEIEIPGKPVHMQRHRSFLRNGRICMFNPQEEKKKQLHSQCKLLLMKYKNKFPLSGQINICFDFFLQRPKSHFRTGKNAEILKENAPAAHIFKPDIDNLVKFYMDVLNGIAYHDDSQAVSLIAHKRYCSKADEERTEIWFTHFN